MFVKGVLEGVGSCFGQGEGEFGGDVISAPH